MTFSATISSSSEAETLAVGEEIGRRMPGGMCVCVNGPLGSGKSVFVRGVCRGLGIEESVVSPSFILCEEYQGRLPVLHIDLYRLEHEREIEALGVFDRIDGNTVILAEWGDRSEWLSGEADLTIHLGVTGTFTRTIDLHSVDADIVKGF
jgi:tRNA threonylcarbamoyladenosine biosynthesis protein TsaE